MFSVAATSSFSESAFSESVGQKHQNQAPADDWVVVWRRWMDYEVIRLEPTRAVTHVRAQRFSSHDTTECGQDDGWLTTLLTLTSRKTTPQTPTAPQLHRWRTAIQKSEGDS